MVERPTPPEAGKLPAAVAEWRESIRALREATWAAVGAVAALRREAATAMQQLRPQGGDRPPPAEAAVLSRIAARLQGVEQELERQTRVLRDRESQALSSVLSILQRTAQDLRRARTQPPRPAGDPQALRAVQSGVAALGQRLEALEQALPRHVSEASGPLRADLARAVQEVRDHARDLHRALDGDERRAELLGGLEAMASTLRQEVASGVKSVSERIGALDARIADDVGARGSAERQRDEHQKRLETAMIVLKDEVVLMATALREEVARPIAELAADRATLRGGLERVDRLAEIVESLGRRRGFRELVEAEQALHAEQAAFVERLNAAAEGLTAMASGVERRLQRLVEEAAERVRPDPGHLEALAGAEASMTALREDLPAAVTDLVARVEGSMTGVQERIEALPAALGGQKDGGEDRQAALRAQRELRSATTALKRQVEALAKRIDGWGKPRTAPKLAQEVRDLGRRFEALEEEVESKVAATVARRVQASVDRRLRALVEGVSEEIRQVAREAAAEAAAESAPESPPESAPESPSPPAAEPASEPVRQPTPRFAPEPERRGRFRRPRR